MGRIVTQELKALAQQISERRDDSLCDELGSPRFRSSVVAFVQAPWLPRDRAISSSDCRR